MNKILKLSFLSLGFLSLIFLCPKDVRSENFQTGDLIKIKGDTNIYYYASDDKIYPFNNANVFKSWYRDDFSILKRIEMSDFRKMKLGAKPITVRPGKQLVYFENNNKVYAVARGGVLREVENEQVAKDLYGDYWYEDLVQLRSIAASYYLMGEPIRDKEDYNRAKNWFSASNVNDSLIERGLVNKNTVKTSSRETTEVSRLKSLVESLSDNFSPSFNPYITGYTITAKYEERMAILKPTAYDPDTIIKINNLRVNSGVDMGIKLEQGVNEVEILVIDPNRLETTYTVTIYRTKASSNADLKALLESSPSASFEPAFSSSITNYELNLPYGESGITLKPVLANSKAKMYVNGVEKPSNQNIHFNLDYGDNKIEIKVRAENGRYKNYEITINRSPYKNLNDASLSSIVTSVSSGISPSFNKDITNYKIKTGIGVSQAIVQVSPINSNALISINGLDTKRYISDVPGLVTIEVVSPDGLERTYKVDIEE